MSTLDKIAYFYTALMDVYRSEENKESMDIKIDFKPEEFTEDMTAILFAMFTFYHKLSCDEDSDIIDFVNLLNKLAVQKLLEDNGVSVDE